MLISQRITGSTRLVGIIGNPVKHSLSPIIHNHLFSTLNLPYAYVPLGVEQAGLGNLVTTLRNINAVGANVTIPFKSDILQYCDEISPLSKLTETANTLYFREGKLCATTTDYLGFLAAIKSEGAIIEESNVVILGNGGTARTLAIALANDKKIKSLAIIGRNRAKIAPLAEEVTRKTGFIVEQALFDTPACAALMQQCTILVNCTPVGMEPAINATPLDPNYLNTEMFVFDAIYNPAETLLLRHAKERGCRCVNGLPMLLFQGLASFEYWTGIQPPPDAIDIRDFQALL